ncbi:MAG: YkgJ family cysteine cluster protein [Planctomycetaceae bacterium]
MGPCESCHAGCCRSFAVPLTGSDILQIQESLDLTFWDFACRWADPENTIARRYAPQFYFSDEPQMPFVICLIQRESTYFPDTRSCRFLMEGQPDEESPYGEARCGIYNARPSACRVFPARFHQSSDLAIIDNPNETQPASGDSVYNLCPRPWKQGDLHPLRTMRNLAVAKFEMTFFHNVAAIWNRNPQEWSLFPTVLRDIYNRRIVNADLVERESVETPDSVPATIPLPHVPAKAA